MNIGVIIDGFITAFQPLMLGYLGVGFFIGLFFGAVPGLTATLAIVLILPMTYGMDVVPALIMCMGIFMAGIYSGSITATTINIPGAPSSMMTAIEGYPLMQRGEGGKALKHASIASAIGGTTSALVTLFLLGLITPFILMVKTPGKFSLILLALMIVVLIQKKGVFKSIMMALLGLMMATIGMDVLKASCRFHFDTLQLMSGIDLVALVIGVFALSEVLIQAETANWQLPTVGQKLRRRDFIPRLRDLKEIGFKTYFKSTVIGYLTGVLPGAGGSMAAFMSYAESMRSSRHPERYGKGEIQGIAASEAANNAMCGGALVPMLTFGIPGDAVSAIIMGVLIIHGLVPGPLMLQNQIHLVTPMLASLAICAAFLIILSLIVLGPFYVSIVKINRAVLYSFIAMVAMIGAYVATYDVFQMWVAVSAGVIAYVLRKQGYPMVPLIMGFLLGPMVEEYFRMSLMLGGGNLLIFVTKPDSIVFLILTGVFLYFLGVRPHLRQRQQPFAEKGYTDSISID